nr:immunoglobulin heavy chain junction region [Mus musculus]
YCARLGYYFDY